MVMAMMGPADVCVNHGKMLAHGCVEIGMIKIDIETLVTAMGTRRIPYLAGDSGDLHRTAKLAYELYDAQDELAEKKAEYEAASKHLANLMQYHTRSTPTDLDGLWDLVCRMRENRGGPPPEIAPSDDSLHSMIMELLRQEIAQFDAALRAANQAAKDELAGGADTADTKPETGGPQT